MSEPDAVARYQAMIDSAPFHQFLRMTVVEVDADEGRFVLDLPFAERYERMADTGQIHGGPLACLIDIAGTFAVAAKLGHGVPTINLRIDYLRPAMNTSLRATAIVRRAGRTVAVADIDVHDEQERLVATGRGAWGTSAG